MSSFLEENKKFLIVALVIVLFIAGFFVFQMLNSKPTEQATPQNTPTKYVKNDYTLPSLGEISIEDNPILYDAVGCSLGVNSSDYFKPNDGQMLLIAKKDSSKLFYTANSNKTGATQSLEMYLPSPSVTPIPYYLESEVKTNDFFNGINSNNEIERVNVGDWIFILPKGEQWGVTNGTLYGVDLGDLSVDFSKVNSHYNIDDSNGIPITVIRKVCDLETIKNTFGVDFNNSFWDDKQYGENIKCFKNNSKSSFCIISPVGERFGDEEDGETVYTFSINGDVRPMSQIELDKFLSDNGYQTTEEAYSNKVLATDDEVKSKSGEML